MEMRHGYGTRKHWGSTSERQVNSLEEAVISEAVSARWFPVPQENTGKFADFGLEIAKAPLLSGEILSCQRKGELFAADLTMCA
jgi:hypothetical protein